MRKASRTVREELRTILAFIGVIWTVFLVSLAVPGVKSYGVIPRTIGGIVGIAAMPFLHANWQHIVGNTVPLFVLLALLAGSRARSWVTVAGVAGLGGSLLWLFGRSANHIGASGLIFGLAAFLLFAGFLERRFVPLLVSLVVAFLYGGLILWGVIPRVDSSVSWDGHLCGAVAGGLVALGYTRGGRSTA